MPGPPQRLLVFSLVILAIALGFIVRLVQLQLLRGEDYFQLSQANYNRRLRVAAPRGKILDRHGRVLAENRPNFQLTLHLPEVRGLDSAIDVAAHLLGLGRSKLEAILEKQKVYLGTTLAFWRNKFIEMIGPGCRPKFPVSKASPIPLGTLAASIWNSDMNAAIPLEKSWVIFWVT